MLHEKEFSGSLLELLMMLKTRLYLLTVNICLDQYTFQCRTGNESTYFTSLTTDVHAIFYGCNKPLANQKKLWLPLSRN